MTRYIPFLLWLVLYLSSGNARAQMLPLRPSSTNWKMVALSTHIVIGDLELLKIQGDENRLQRPKPEDRFLPAVVTVTSLLKGEHKQGQIQIWMPLDTMPYLRNPEPNAASLKRSQVMLFLQKDVRFHGFYSTYVSQGATLVPAVLPIVRAVKTEIESQRRINEGFTLFWRDRVKKYQGKLTVWLRSIRDAAYSSQATESINSILALGNAGYVLMALHLTDETALKEPRISIENRRPDAQEGLIHLEAKTIGQACSLILDFALPDSPGSISYEHEEEEQRSHTISAWRVYAHYMGLTRQTPSVSGLPSVTMGDGEATGVGKR